jgi:hypothetical protein
MGRAEPPPGTSRRVDARALWSGGAATAVVAALIALVGILVSRWLFKIPILSPQRDGAWGDASTVGYVFASAAIALFATAIMHLLLLSTPRPRTFYTWIAGLATVIAVVFPFSTTAPLSQKDPWSAESPCARRGADGRLGGRSRWLDLDGPVQGGSSRQAATRRKRHTPSTGAVSTGAVRFGQYGTVRFGPKVLPGRAKGP